MHFIGLDIHKKIIAFCIKTASGRIIKRGTISATRQAVNKWLENLPQPWMAAMEATLFTGWIYDFLKPHAYQIKVAHPAMLKAITAAKKRPPRRAETKPISNGCPPTFFEYTFAIKGGAK
jgi:hypothetical protein